MTAFADATGAASAKSAMRAAALAGRGAAAAEAVKAFDGQLATIGPALAQDCGARVVSAYWPIGDEAPTLSLLAALDAAGLTVGLPVTGRRGEALVFRQWRRGAVMAVGRMGIAIPTDDAPVVEPDFLFVPLAAFDRRGHRIGYGAGFYDCTLAELRARHPIMAVGLAYAGQEVEAVPHEAHDQALDMIVTEHDLIDCRATR